MKWGHKTWGWGRKQRCAGHEILIFRRTRLVGLARLPHLVPQLVFLNATRTHSAPIRSKCLKKITMITFTLTTAHLTYTCCSISPNKTPFFVFISPCFIMPKNLGVTGAQFINSSKITCMRSHKSGSIERHDDFRCSFVSKSKLSHPAPK